MFKVRLLLGVVMALCVAGFNMIYGSQLGPNERFLAYGLDAILYLSALITMGSSFFSLNEKGQIPVGSLLHRVLTYWGVDISTDKIKLCPMYWLIVFSFLVLCAVIGMGGIVLWVAASLVSAGIAAFVTDPISGGYLLLQIAQGTLVLVLGYLCLRDVFEDFQVKDPGFAAVLTIGAVAITVSLGMLTQQYCDVHRVSVGYAIGLGLVTFMKFLVGFAISFAAVFGALTAIIYLCSKAFPIVANSFVGQFAATAFSTMCPVLEIEQK